MPLDFGVPDLIRAEVDRFTDNLGELAIGAENRARAAAAYERPGSAVPRAIVVPGWDDVIHIRPRVQVSAEERSFHYEALKAGRASPLSGEKVEQLERNRVRARAMRQSASPEYAKAYGQVLTAIDNVQDLTTTIAVAGRITMNPAIRALEAIGATTLPVVAPVSRIGARIVGRALPVIGWVLLAGDLLKLLNIIGIWAFPFFALACRGTLAGAAATVPALLIGSALCARIGKWAESSPFGRRARLKRSRVARTWRPSIYNLMEVAQTTDALYGRGLVFGGLVGMVMDGAFGTAMQIEGKAVRLELGAYRGSASRLFEDARKELSAAQLHVHRVAASVLASGPLIARTQEDFTAEEHMVAMAAYSAALAFLRPWIERPETVEAVNEALTASWAPPAYLADQVAGELADVGEWDPASVGVWPLPGNPRTITGQQMLDLGDEVTEGLRRLLAPRRDTIEGAFMGALAVRILERTALLFAGDPHAFEFQVEEHWQVMATLARLDRLVNTQADEGAIEGAFQDAARWIEEHGRREVPGAVLDAIFAAREVPLLHLEPPELWRPRAPAST